MLSIQDPNYAAAPTALDSFLAVFPAANRLRMTFAYASASGIHMLFASAAFIDFIDQYECDLILGTDAVTNFAAHEAIKSIAAKHPNLKVQFIVREFDGRTFHPKFCLATCGESGILVVGSSNLTKNGLLSNWEAFADIKLGKSAHKKSVKKWKDWLKRLKPFLRPLGHADTIAAVKANKLVIKSKKKLTAKDKLVIAESDVSTMLGKDLECLICEIPGAKGRMNQANFKKGVIEDFFGIPVYSAEHIALTKVADDGTRGPSLSKQLVSAASKNYRFELDSGGREYPISPAAIGVFVKTSKKSFLYKLIFPDEKQYTNIQALVNAKNLAKSNQKKFCYINSNSLPPGVIET